MVRLSEATPDPTLKSVEGWLRKFISHHHPRQRVVGNRHKEDGDVVTQEEFDKDERVSHVCPFVLDSMDTGNFYVERSEFTHRDVPAIGHRLDELATAFCLCEPAFDPGKEGTAAPVELALKCFLLYFPDFGAKHSGGSLPAMDTVHEIYKARFMERGLTLGQFYPGCPEKGVYSDDDFRSLISPVPAFAIRYLAKHDSLFNPPNSPTRGLYERYFPVEN